MSEITTKREPQSQTMTWLLVAIWVIAGFIGLLFVEYSSFQVILLTLTGGLVVILLLVSISQELSINRSKYFIIIPAILIGFWLAAQILFNGLPPDSSVLNILVRWKNYLGVIAVFVGALFVIDRFGRSALTFRIFLIWFIFVLIAAISMIRYNYFNWALLMMYFGWIVYVTLVIPNLTNNQEDWLRLIKIVTIISLIPLLGFILKGFLSGDIFFTNPVRTRVTFVFNEPHKYAQYLAVCLVALTIFVYNAKRNTFNLFMWLGIIVLAILVVLTDSRNTITFLIVFALSVYLYKYHYQRFRIWFSIGIFLLPVLSVLLGLGLFRINLDYDEINTLSSDRLTKFDDLAQNYLINAPFSDYLLGTSFQSTFQESQQESQYVIRPVQKAVEEDRYQRAHIENMYYQIGLSHGLIGLFTFLLPLGLIYFLLHKSLRYTYDRNRINIILAIASINALLIQSIFTDTIPSFGNALSIFLPLLWLPPLLHLSHQRKSTERIDPQH